MKRLLLGLALGACGSAIAYASGAVPYWVIATGVMVAVLAWTVQFVLDH